MPSTVCYINGAPVIVEFNYSPFMPSRAFEEPDSPEEIEITDVQFHGVSVIDIMEESTLDMLQDQISENRNKDDDGL